MKLRRQASSIEIESFSEQHVEKPDFRRKSEKTKAQRVSARGVEQKTTPRTQRFEIYRKTKTNDDRLSVSNTTYHIHLYRSQRRPLAQRPHKRTLKTVSTHRIMQAAQSNRKHNAMISIYFRTPIFVHAPHYEPINNTYLAPERKSVTHGLYYPRLDDRKEVST